nr:transposase [Lichenicoccus roseus]
MTARRHEDPAAAAGISAHRRRLPAAVYPAGASGRADEPQAVVPALPGGEAWCAQAGRSDAGAGDALADGPMDYMLKRWTAFTRFLEDGRICLTNNAAERALRGIAIGRKAWLLAGSDRGGERAAAIYSLIVTARLNDVDPRAWLGDTLRRIADHPAQRLNELLPWNYANALIAKQSAA